MVNWDKHRAALALYNTFQAYDPNQAPIAMRAAIHALKAQPNNARVQLSACGTLYQACREDDKQTKKVLSANVLQSLTATLTRHTADEEVEQSGLRLIRCLLHAVMTQYSQRDEEQTITPSLILAIVIAINTHPLSEQVQEQGCRLLDELSGAGRAASAESRWSRRRRLIFEAGGLADLHSIQSNSPHAHIREAAELTMQVISSEAGGQLPAQGETLDWSTTSWLSGDVPVPSLHAIPSPSPSASQQHATRRAG